MLLSHVSLRPPPALSVALLKFGVTLGRAVWLPPGPQGPRPKTWPQQLRGPAESFPHGTGPSLSWHFPRCLTTQSIPLETQASNNGHVGTPAPSSGRPTPSPSASPGSRCSLRAWLRPRALSKHTLQQGPCLPGGSQVCSPLPSCLGLACPSMSREGWRTPPCGMLHSTCHAASNCRHLESSMRMKEGSDRDSYHVCAEQPPVL